MDYVPTTANSLSHSHKTIPLKCVINGTTDYVPTTAKSVSQTHKTVHLIRTLLCFQEAAMDIDISLILQQISFGDWKLLYHLLRNMDSVTAAEWMQALTKKLRSQKYLHKVPRGGQNSRPSHCVKSILTSYSHAGVLISYTLLEIQLMTLLLALCD